MFANFTGIAIKVLYDFVTDRTEYGRQLRLLGD